MLFREGRQDDQQAILSLFQQATLNFKQEGINQWQDGYPNEENIRQDRLNQSQYVLEDNHKIIGCETVSFASDENYKKMVEGQWLTQNPYAVIHRIVVDETRKRQGIAKVLLHEAIRLCKQRGVWSIKIDTHQDNKAMRQFLLNNDFQYCGIIQLQRDKTYRVAYERIIRE